MTVSRNSLFSLSKRTKKPMSTLLCATIILVLALVCLFVSFVLFCFLQIVKPYGKVARSRNK